METGHILLVFHIAIAGRLEVVENLGQRLLLGRTHPGIGDVEGGTVEMARILDRVGIVLHQLVDRRLGTKTAGDTQTRTFHTLLFLETDAYLLQQAGCVGGEIGQGDIVEIVALMAGDLDQLARLEEGLDVGGMPDRGNAETMGCLELGMLVVVEELVVVFLELLAFHIVFGGSLGSQIAYAPPHEQHHAAYQHYDI